MSSERTYERLLHLYPADYPRDEMLGVLLANGRPRFREVPALVLGGLRARAGGGLSLLGRWRYSARAAALILLVVAALAPVEDLRWGTQLRTSWTVATWVCAGLAAAALVFGARLVAFVATVAALGLSATDEISTSAVAGFTLAALLLMIPGPATPVRNPLLALLAVAASLSLNVPEAAELALVLAVLLWTVVDERILLACGLAFCVNLFEGATMLTFRSGTDASPISFALWLGVPAALIAIGGGLAWRRSKI